MSRVFHHFASQGDAGQPGRARRQMSAAGIFVLAVLGAAGGLAALNLILRLYAPG